MEMIIYGLVMLAALCIGLFFSRLEVKKFDYEVMPDWLQRKRKEALAQSAFKRMVDPLVRVLGAICRRFPMENHRSKVGHNLVNAGYPDGYNTEEFIGYCMVVGLLAGGAMFGLRAIGGSFGLILPTFVGAIAYLLTAYNLKGRADERRTLIDRQIPYFLDLTSLTMGAGATFQQACGSIAEGPVTGPMEEEVSLMLAEIDAGTPMTDALGNMTKRSDSEELHTLVSAVKQGEELGTPLVEVFEIQSSMNRFRRSKRGEQLAAKLPNRMALPNTFLLLSVLVLLFGPIIVKAVRGELG
jgi:tight adherence protein C